MPVGVVKTRSDEKKWKKAKAITRKQYGETKWPVVMKIFQSMKKKAHQELLEKAASSIIIHEMFEG